MAAHWWRYGGSFLEIWWLIGSASVAIECLLVTFPPRGSGLFRLSFVPQLYLGHSGAISADKLNTGGSLITGPWPSII